MNQSLQHSAHHELIYFVLFWSLEVTTDWEFLTEMTEDFELSGKTSLFSPTI